MVRRQPLHEGSHFYTIYVIQRFITFITFFGLENTESTQILVHAFVSSRLDHGNSLLFGLPQYEIQKLHSVQNACARLIFTELKHSRVIPFLRDLHRVAC